MLSAMRTALVAALASSLVCLVGFPTSAFAQDPPKAPSKYDPGYTDAPTPVAITPTCTLENHSGISDAEAHTAAEIVCYELAKQHAGATPHDVRFGTLGGRTMVVVSSHGPNGVDERRTFITGMDEITVAAPRLVSALVEGKQLEETRNVDNVLASETPQQKLIRGVMAFDGGIYGGTGLGASSGASAGVGVGLLYRAGNLGVGGQGRAGGIGSNNEKLTSLSLDVGARYYLSTADIAPYIGGGFEISAFEVKNAQGDISGSGCGAYGAVGVELLRTHNAAISASLRADLPFYSLTGDSYSYASSGYTSGGYTKRSEYVVPLTFNVGFIFR
jgi:hypothetical protein